MNDYVLVFPNGSVLDAYRWEHEPEQDFIDRQVKSGVCEIHRRGDGVVVYEKETPK